MYEPGYGTEYSDNYFDKGVTTSRTKEASGLFNGSQTQTQLRPGSQSGPAPGTHHSAQGSMQQHPSDPTAFHSDKYPSVYRETVIRKDDRGNYIDPFNNIATKPYGRRLMYDDTHPDKMYPSQWSSELADAPGPYSFPTTTGLDPEIPWTKDMQWQVSGEVGRWPTEEWKNWTNVAVCPPYDGHDDQVEYHQYKVQVP